MANEADSAAQAGDHSKDYTLATVGGVPNRTDNRGFLHMLHDELGKALGIKPGAKQDFVDGGDTVMNAVNKATANAPAPGTNEY